MDFIFFYLFVYFYLFLLSFQFFLFFKIKLSSYSKNKKRPVLETKLRPNDVKITVIFTFITACNNNDSYKKLVHVTLMLWWSVNCTIITFPSPLLLQPLLGFVWTARIKHSNWYETWNISFKCHECGAKVEPEIIVNNCKGDRPHNPYRRDTILI